MVCRKKLKRRDTQQLTFSGTGQPDRLINRLGGKA